MKRFDLGILIAAVALAAGGAGFAAGHLTAAKTASSTGASNSAGGSARSGDFGGGGGGGGGGFRRGGFGTRGTVTAVSGSTITISDQNGTSHVVNVSSSTVYSNGSDRSAATLSDVTTGSTILAAGQTATDGSIAATRIIINPTTPGGGASGSSSGGGSAPGA